LLLLLLLRCSWYTYLLLARMHEVPDLDNKAGNGVRRLDRCDTRNLVFNLHSLSYRLLLLNDESVINRSAGRDRGRL
jgi:hypothetical protein